MVPFGGWVTICGASLHHHESSNTYRNLLAQMTKLLDGFGVVNCFAGRKGSVIASGEGSLRQFLRQIGFSNPHHNSRIERYHPELIGLNRAARRSHHAHN